MMTKSSAPICCCFLASELGCAHARGIALIRRQSSRNPAYQTLAPFTPRRPLPDPDVLLRSPYTRRTRAHIRQRRATGPRAPPRDRDVGVLREPERLEAAGLDRAR